MVESSLELGVHLVVVFEFERVVVHERLWFVVVAGHVVLQLLFPVVL